MAVSAGLHGCSMVLRLSGFSRSSSSPWRHRLHDR
jgi:hypothetical protein